MAEAQEQREPKNTTDGETDRKEYVYILRCSDGTLYTGWTNDLSHRIAAHNGGKGAKYTRSRRPVELVYFETFQDRIEAQHRERAIKKLSRKEKEQLIQQQAIPGALK